jgi:NAD(P)-dependent dehydrogenase (short-subunit alcohol dehydrogenase family)
VTEQPPAQQQDLPGTDAALTPQADHGESSYKGSGRLAGKATVITGADSGIGRAVAIAFAREGADVLISYLSEHEDAKETARHVEEAGRRAVLVSGDLADAEHCKEIVAEAVRAFGRVDVLVNNAAYQMARGRDSIEDIPDDEWDRTFATNITAMFHTVKAALPHMKEGSSIINTTSVQADQPSPNLLPYAATKAAIVNFTGNLAQMLGERGIRANCVAPGPIWTPLIPATMEPDKVEDFGGETPLGRAGQPAELAPVYVMLASDEASYVSAANIAVTGGMPVI